MALETVLVESDRHVATLTLDRASSGNAINRRMAYDLRDAFDELRHDDEIFAVVVTGRGDAFCRGTDPSALEQSSDRLETPRSLRVAESLGAFEKPVIAAINGDALDQGLELALACDIRIASENVRLGLTQISDGLIPWDGGTQRLPRLIGRGRATEMILASRIIGAQEALDVGLLSDMVGRGRALQHAQEIAQTVASHGPIASRYIKEAVSKGTDMTLRQGLRLEADLNIILQSTSDRAEGIRSFLARRTPEYRGE